MEGGQLAVDQSKPESRPWAASPLVSRLNYNKNKQESRKPLHSMARADDRIWEGFG
jgi:hypothetical protein